MKREILDQNLSNFAPPYNAKVGSMGVISPLGSSVPGSILRSGHSD